MGKPRGRVSGQAGFQSYPEGNADATRAHPCSNDAANIAAALGFHQNRVVGFPRPTRKKGSRPPAVKFAPANRLTLPGASSDKGAPG